ncbi:MAG TPA: type VI secretion system tip protein TssI/VgrG [Bryobacteraceae bacterium]|nr:type VI secretion system tip protein TssI/VgrG [Bryobacteraceae bacterium]
MADLHTDDNRLLSIKTVLPANTLLVNRFSANERLSRLFSFDIELMAPLEKAADVKPAELIGSAAAVRLETPDGDGRFFHGVFSRFQEGSEDTQFRFYRAELSPKLWLLTLTTDCRVFENKNALDIVTDILREQGQLDFLDFTTRSYARWDCCMQYRETMFNFISRLLEHEGIFYFFQHQADKHILCFADQLAGSYDSGNSPVIQFLPGTSPSTGQQVMTSWNRSTLLTPGKFTTRDFHYGTPKNTLEFSEQTVKPLGGNSKFEVYEFPGEHAVPFNEKARFGEATPEGERVARNRMEEEETPQITFAGESRFPLYKAGFKFLLLNHPTLDGTFVPISIQHSVEQSGSHFHEEAVLHAYVCAITCAKFGNPYRPPRLALRPVMQGPQTATVVGPAGKEIHTDEFGRIKVQFPWDRRKQGLGCFVRVAQTWAGPRWGAQFIPRIGHEVLVDFIEGDPDQPIVIGSVYNGVNQFPYDLPAHQTQSGIKSRSTPDGTPAQFNEIRFEDQKGQELLVIHAQQTKSESVEGNSFESVGGDRESEVGCNRIDVVDKLKISYVKESRLDAVEEHFFMKVVGDRMEKTTGDHVYEVTGQLHITGTLGIVIESPLQISLKVGANFVDISPAGVTIVGTAVLINSGGKAGEGKPFKPPSAYGGDLAIFETEPEPADPDPAAPPFEPAPNPNPLPPPPPPPLGGT